MNFFHVLSLYFSIMQEDLSLKLFSPGRMRLSQGWAEVGADSDDWRLAQAEREQELSVYKLDQPRDLWSLFKQCWNVNNRIRG